MKKGVVLSLSFVVLLAWAAVPAFSWGSATHAYILDHIGKKLPLMNANELYGVMGADIFNYVFTLTPEQMAYVSAYTHGSPGDERFMEVWKKARWWGFEKSLAFGYVAHNEVWGCDFTAHIHALTTGLSEGYVITKAKLLMPYLAAVLYQAQQQAGIPDSNKIAFPDDINLMLCHNLIENAGDILLLRADPQIGQKIVTASVLRSNDFPELVTRAMGPGWKDAVFAAEKEFRKTMILYGAALMQGEQSAIQTLSAQIAQIGVAYVKAQTGLDIPLDLATYLATAGTTQGMVLIAGDYMQEVNATVNFVKMQLVYHGVRY
jgi:hypothetical protein